MATEFSEINNGDVLYPALLNEISKPPDRLYCRGVLPDPNTPTIAIVGTRKATDAGVKLAEQIAEELSHAGVIIISGLAMGIDAAAHRGAISHGGKTIAVLGNGIDTVYPAQNEQLGGKILDTHGCILSEYGPGTPSFKGAFIQRNRIISGLSLGVLVIEAPARSGALATAGFAADQGRNVFVIPGPVNNVNYAGSHSLIRDGAVLVTSARDILDDIGIETSVISEEEMTELNEHENAVVSALVNAGELLTVDKIIEMTKLDPQVVSGAIAALTISGIIRESESGYELSNR